MRLKSTFFLTFFHVLGFLFILRESRHDKQDGEEKVESLTVDAFIGRLIRHIPDKQFKMIRHYGLYSRRIKTLMKGIVTIYQESIKKLLVNAKKMIQPKGWRESNKESFGYDPLKCSECGNVLEFRGIVARKNGQLEVQYANDKEAKDYINREVERIESEAYKKAQKEKTEVAIKKYRFSWS